MNKYMPLAKIITTVAFMIIGVSVAQPSDFQVVHQHPDTSLQFNPESGLPTATETQADTILILDHETGLPVSESGTQPEPQPTIGELGANESTKIQPVPGGMINLLKRFGGRPFPFQIIRGLAIDKDSNNSEFLMDMVTDPGGSLAISYSFSKGIKISGSRNLYESFNLYPTLTLGILLVNWDFPVTSYYYPEIEGFGGESESILYGMIEGHKRWEIKNFWAVLVLGTGIGNYSTGAEKYDDQGIFVDHITKSGLGLMVSAGAQFRSQRFMGALRFYRTPGFGRIVTFANAGYQPKSYMEAFIVGAGSFALFLAIKIALIPGS